MNLVAKHFAQNSCSKLSGLEYYTRTRQSSDHSSSLSHKRRSQLATFTEVPTVCNPFSDPKSDPTRTAFGLYMNFRTQDSPTGFLFFFSLFHF